MVDFAFFGVYALMGPYSLELMTDYRFVVNKLLALFLITDLCFFINRMCCIVLFDEAPRHDQFSSKVAYESAFDGIPDNKRHVRQAKICNLIYNFKMIFYQVILVAAQNSPAFCLIMLDGLTLFGLVYFVLCSVRYRPWNNVGTLL